MTIERMDLLKTAGAVFSDCMKYRYHLWREWDPDKPRVVFIMLNPSTADETVNDSTITKCIEFAKRWGHGSMAVVNLFAWRSTYPESMKQVAEPIGPENDYYIAHASLNASRVVCAWGNHGDHLNRSKTIMNLMNLMPSIKEYFVFKLNLTGQPAHPLYQPYDRELEKFNCDFNPHKAEA